MRPDRIAVFAPNLPYAERAASELGYTPDQWSYIAEPRGVHGVPEGGFYLVAPGAWLTHAQRQALEHLRRRGWRDVAEPDGADRYRRANEPETAPRGWVPISRELLGGSAAQREDEGPAAAHLSSDASRSAYAAAGDLAALGDARDDDLDWPFDWGRPAPMLVDEQEIEDAVRGGYTRAQVEAHAPVRHPETTPVESDEDQPGTSYAHLDGCECLGCLAQAMARFTDNTGALRAALEDLGPVFGAAGQAFERIREAMAQAAPDVPVYEVSNPDGPSRGMYVRLHTSDPAAGRPAAEWESVSGYEPLVMTWDNGAFRTHTPAEFDAEYDVFETPDADAWVRTMSFELPPWQYRYLRDWAGPRANPFIRGSQAAYEIIDEAHHWTVDELHGLADAFERGLLPDLGAPPEDCDGRPVPLTEAPPRVDLSGVDTGPYVDADMVEAIRAGQVVTLYSGNRWEAVTPIPDDSPLSMRPERARRRA